MQSGNLKPLVAGRIVYKYSRQKCLHSGYVFAMSMQDICIFDQAQGQDGWILAKFFPCVFIEHLDRTSLVNKGFIIWPKDYNKEFRFYGNKAGNPEWAR